MHCTTSPVCSTLPVCTSRLLSEHWIWHPYVFNVSDFRSLSFALHMPNCTRADMPQTLLHSTFAKGVKKILQIHRTSDHMHSFTYLQKKNDINVDFILLKEECRIVPWMLGTGSLHMFKRFRSQVWAWAGFLLQTWLMSLWWGRYTSGAIFTKHLKAKSSS